VKGAAGTIAISLAVSDSSRRIEAPQPDARVLADVGPAGILYPDQLISIPVFNGTVAEFTGINLVMSLGAGCPVAQ
jgi:hypothetical protein